MALVDPELAAFEEVRTMRTRRCWFKRLDEDQQRIATKAWKQYSGPEIARVVAQWLDAPLTGDAIAKHFSGRCACD